MNDCTDNSQYFEIEELYEPTTSAQLYKTNISLAEKDIETDIENEEDDICEEEPLWSIDDDTLFYPLGLINHSTEIGKSVFVTWNEIYIQNFIFKKSKKTKKMNMTKVRLTLPPNEEIKEILILEYNTLLLMQSGNVYYFSSVKSMHAISWLTGVRCISISPEGFSVIRLLKDNTLSLETYRDIPGIGKSESTLLISYDITFDSMNLFNCQWMDERYTLLSQLVEKKHLKLMNKFLRHTVDLHVNDIVHFFTVSGNLFALIAGNPKHETNKSDDFNIKLLNTYATSVECMKIDLLRQICIIFLQCGSIDIWYISSFMDVVQRKSHYTGSSFAHYDYNPLNATFYYTDTEKVGQLEFKYDSIADIYTVQETFKAIPDIIVCSWVDNIQHLIGLSSNNVFYKLSFQASDAPISLEPNPEFENFSQLYELTKSRMTKLLAKAHFAEELINMPVKINKQIEEECLKQQLISVANKKDVFKRLLKGSISYKRYVDRFEDKNIIYLFAQQNQEYCSNRLFAFIEIQRIPHIIFEKYIWNIHVNTGKSIYNFILHKKLSQNKICIILPLLYEQSNSFPSVDLNFLTFISNDCNEFLAVLLPVKLNYNSTTFADLFSLNNLCSYSANFININNVLKAFNDRNEATRTLITVRTASFNLPKEFKFNDVSKIFSYENDILEENESLSIYFLNTLVILSYCEDTYSVNLECACPVALYYTKLYLLYKVKDTLDDIWRNKIDEGPTSSKKAHLYTQYQCEVERCYGSLTESGDITSESTAVHLENLNRIYKKLRTTPIQVFR